MCWGEEGRSDCSHENLKNLLLFLLLFSVIMSRMKRMLLMLLMLTMVIGVNQEEEGDGDHLKKRGGGREKGTTIILIKQ